MICCVGDGHVWSSGVSEVLIVISAIALTL